MCSLERAGRGRGGVGGAKAAGTTSSTRSTQATKATKATRATRATAATEGAGTAGVDRGRVGLGPYGYVLAQARSNPFRTGATVATVAVSVAFLIIVASLSVGLSGGTEVALLDHKTGTPVLPISEFTLTREGRYAGLLAPTLLDPSDLNAIRIRAQEVVGDPAKVSVYPYTELALGRRPLGGLEFQRLRLVGVDPAIGLATPYLSYNRTTSLALGEPLSSPDGAQVVLGYRLWQEKFPGIQPGAHITVQPENASLYSAPVEQLRARGDVTLTRIDALADLELVGVLDKVVETDLCAFVPLGYLANLTGAGATATGPRCEAVSVEVRDPSVDLEALGRGLASLSPRVTSYYVTASRPSDASGLREGLRSSIYGWLVIAAVVTVAAMVLGVSNTVLLSVAQRRREIGTLRALGLARRDVLRLVTYEALFLVMMGWIVGFLSGHIVVSTMSGSRLQMEGLGLWLAPGRTVPSIAVGSFLAALLAALAGAALPGARASALEPAEALSGP